MDHQDHYANAVRAETRVYRRIVSRGLGYRVGTLTDCPGPVQWIGRGAMVPGSECVWGVHTLRARRNDIGRLTDHLEPAKSLRYRTGSRLCLAGAQRGG